MSFLDKYELVRNQDGAVIAVRNRETGQYVVDPETLNMALGLMGGGVASGPAGLAAGGMGLLRGAAPSLATRAVRGASAAQMGSPSAQPRLQQPPVEVRPAPTFQQTLEAQRAARAAGRPTPRVYEADIVRPQQPQLPAPQTPALPAPRTPALPAPQAGMPYTLPVGAGRSMLGPAAAAGVGAGMLGGALYSAGQPEEQLMTPGLQQTPAFGVDTSGFPAAPPASQFAQGVAPTTSQATPAPVKGKPSGKGAGRAKAAAAELAAMKAMGETTGGAAGGPPSPSTQQAVPMTPSGRPDYNYYADMMNAVDSNDAYYRDFVRLRNDARMAARQAQIRGERFQFVPLRDYKANRVYLVNADGTDVVLNMDDPQDQKQYQRMVSDLGIDSNRLSDWTDRSSRTLARYFMPQGMQDTTPDFGFLPRRPMVDETKAAPAMQPKEPGMPMPETQGELSPLGLSLAKGPMLPKGQQLRMPGAGPAFSELELAAMGYRQPSAVPPATPSAPMERRPPGSRPADVMPTTPSPRAAQLSPMEISQRSIGSALGASQAMGQIGSAGMPERPSDEEIRRAMLAAEGQRNYEQAEQWERRLPREIPDNPLMPRPYRYSPK